MLPLVLVPGMMCDARMWGALEAGLPGRTVHHLLPVGAATMQDLAALALRAAPPRFALAGLSMGGILAMEMLRQAPDRVERLALLDTNALAEADEMRARRLPQITRANADLDAVMRDEMIPNYLAPGPDKAGIADLCRAMARDLGPEVFAQQSLALRARPDQQVTLAGFHGPALVSMGEHDRVCPRARHDIILAQMPQARFRIIPGAGHIPPLDRPEGTLSEIIDWLEA